MLLGQTQKCIIPSTQERTKATLKKLKAEKVIESCIMLAFPARRAVMGKSSILHWLAAYINIEEQMMSLIPPSYMEVKLQC